MPAFQPAYPGAKQYLLAGYSEDTAAGSSTFFTRFARHAIAVTNNDPASIEPSRSNVFHEIASLFPKHPQLISCPFRYALTINVRNTTSSIDVTVVANRCHRPTSSSTPISNSNQGSV